MMLNKVLSNCGLITQIFQKPPNNLKFLIYGNCKYSVLLFTSITLPDSVLVKTWPLFSAKAICLACMASKREKLFKVLMFV